MRQAGSRVEPSGRCFALLTAPFPLPPSPPTAYDEEENAIEYRPDHADSDDGDDDEEEEEVESRSAAGNKVYLMTSDDFGGNWSYAAPMPDKLQVSLTSTFPLATHFLIRI